MRLSLVCGVATMNPTKVGTATDEMGLLALALGAVLVLILMWVFDDD